VSAIENMENEGCPTYIINIAKLLLEKGADVNALSKSKRSALFSVCSKEKVSVELVGLLLERGSDPNVLICAISNENCPTDVIRLLLDKGADIHSQDENKRSSLLIACGRKKISVELVDLLVERGSDPMEKTIEGETPIRAALSNENCPTDVIRHLLGMGVDVSAEESTGDSLLLMCMRKHVSIELVELLLQRGANPYYALPRAIIDACPINIIKLLVDRGLENFIDIGDTRTKRTAIHLACILGRDEFSVELVEFLLQRGYDPNAIDSEGNTALLCASKNRRYSKECRIDILKLLLDVGADINAQDKYKRSALHNACGNDLPVEVVEFLLERGIDPHAKDNYFHTPLDIIRRKSYPTKEVIQMLLVKGSSINPNIHNHELGMIDSDSGGNYFTGLHKGRSCCGKCQSMFFILTRWHTTMAIVMFQELGVYHHIDSSSIIDLWLNITDNDFVESFLQDGGRKKFSLYYK
jgi:ankyrin repeat protein